jgi:mRNA interferase RelE/StbE
LERLAKEEYTAVARAISALEEEPKPRGVKKLAESGLWRLRVGRYRVVYSIEDKERTIVLVRVVRRAEGTYRGL